MLLSVCLQLQVVNNRLQGKRKKKKRKVWGLSYCNNDTCLCDNHESLIYLQDILTQAIALACILFSVRSKIFNVRRVKAKSYISPVVSRILYIYMLFTPYAQHSTKIKRPINKITPLIFAFIIQTDIK